MLIDEKNDAKVPVETPLTHMLKDLKNEGRQHTARGETTGLLSFEHRKTSVQPPKPNQPHRENKLNQLTGKEWIQETNSVWFQKGLGKTHAHAKIERLHPAPFSFQDIARLIRFFTKAGNRVLDPFSGVASTLKACAITGREGVGIELIPKWAELGKKRLKQEVPTALSSLTQTTITGDSRIELPKLQDESFDYIVTSPPYWQILTKKPDHKMIRERLNNGYVTKYSDNELDLGNIADYPTFLKELSVCFKECYRVLREGKYTSIIVSDFRHNSTYQAYHIDIIKIMETHGFRLSGITILVQNSKSLYPYGYPYAYVPNIHHQYILIFQKPNKVKKESNDPAKIN
jgi:DNA modification methylase